MQGPMLGAIWAQSVDGIIGDGEDMPWHLPEDLKHFKDTTSGHPIIMGRRTWESLPFKPLPNRKNIVLSSREAGALSLIHISEPTRREWLSRMPSSA